MPPGPEGGGGEDETGQVVLVVERVGERDLAAHAVPEQERAQARVTRRDGAPERVEVGEESA